MNVEEVWAEATHLPPERQGGLIRRLLQNLGPPDHDVSDAEVARRVQQTDLGIVPDTSHDELRAGLTTLQCLEGTPLSPGRAEGHH